METRKIQLAGQSTYTVSLPKSWASEQGFEPGSRVHLYPHADGSLELRQAPALDADESERELEIGAMPAAAIRDAIRAWYADGSDRIRLTAAEIGDDQRAAVIEAERHLIGISLVSEDPRELVLEAMLSSENTSVVQSFMQLRFAALSMFRDATEAFVRGGMDSSDRLADRRLEVDRLSLLITRQFKRSLTDLAEVDRLEVGRPSLLEYHQTAVQLAQIARSAARIGDAARTFEAPGPSEARTELEAMIGDTDQLLETVCEQLPHPAGVADAYAELETAANVRSRLRSAERALGGEASTDTVSIVCCLRELRLIVGCARRIARIAMQSCWRADRS